MKPPAQLHTNQICSGWCTRNAKKI